MKPKITYLSRKKLSKAKYDHCVFQANNSMVYAYSWFLDSVSDAWGALVLGDYKAVMPIPYLRLKRNLFLKNIYQPDFCQQLGIFSQNDLNSEEANLFFTTFLALKPRSYSFNYQNSNYFSKEKLELKERINYELNLNRPYSTIYANYAKNTQRNIKKALKAELSFSDNIDIDTFLSFKKEQTNYKAGSKQQKKMEKLVRTSFEQGFGYIYGVYNKNQLLATAFIVRHNYRLISLITATNEEGKKKGAFAFLNDTLIKEHANSQMILDFEGSMLSGIARFYKSFGAEQVNYLAFL